MPIVSSRASRRAARSPACSGPKILRPSSAQLPSASARHACAAPSRQADRSQCATERACGSSATRLLRNSGTTPACSSEVLPDPLGPRTSTKRRLFSSCRLSTAIRSRVVWCRPQKISACVPSNASRPTYGLLVHMPGRVSGTGDGAPGPDTSAIRRYPLPLSVSMKRELGTLSPRTCRSLRTAEVMALSLTSSSSQTFFSNSCVLTVWRGLAAK